MEQDALEADPYLKKRISFTHGDHTLQFDVANTLFSSFEVDQGTALLLRAMEIEPPRRVLDLGCGYGVLGITLASLYPEAEVVMADSDLLAVRYAKHNCTLNGVSNVCVVGSIGLERVPPGAFDLIVSNIPAKIGDAAIEQEFILALLERLAPGGAYWFVVVSGLNRLIPKLGTRHDLRLKQVRKRSGHAVYRLYRRE